jgi:hypothetical protein
LEIFAKVTPGSRFEGETVHNVGAAVVVCGELWIVQLEQSQQI